MPDDTIENAIRDAATTPQAVTADGVTVTQRPLADQIAADRYLASKAAAKTKTRGLRFTRIIPPGAAT